MTSTRSIVSRIAVAGLAAALLTPVAASSQTFNFQSEVLGAYAGGERTITSGGVSVRFSAAGLQMRGLGGFPAGSDRVMSTDGDSQLMTMELLGGARATSVSFRNWISGTYTGEVDNIKMTAYDGLNNVLGSVTSTFELIGLSFVGIAKITWDDVGNTGFVVDDIELRGVSAVPEPGTYALVGVGLALVGVARRRRQTA